MNWSAKPLKYGVVSTVEDRGLADLAGIEPGDEILTVNGLPVRDIIDFRFHTSDTRVSILLRRSGREFTVTIDKDYDDSLGLDFTEELFDGVITCRSRCVFCFVDNLPRGMRKTLYIKDDDYRLSFLHGNFITLGALQQHDIVRILEQRLSPLYVSVHATDPLLRKRLMPGGRPDVMPVLQKLAKGGIQLHTQIVLCPGLNDGERMDRTIRDLAQLYPDVKSIAVVPAGLTKYAEARDWEPFSAARAKAVLRQVRMWQRQLRRRLGTRLVFASDELYLLAGSRLPGAAAYERYPQFQNGVGIARSFLDELHRMSRKLPAELPHPISAGLITGRLAEPFIRQLADILNGIENARFEVLPIDNDFLGPSVTAAGLVTGGDMIAQLRGRDLPDILFVPNVMLRDEAFLDDVTVHDVSEALDRRVIPIEPSPQALLDYLREAF